MTATARVDWQALKMRSVLARRHHAIVLAIERNENVTDRRHGSCSTNLRYLHFVRIVRCWRELYRAVVNCYSQILSILAMGDDADTEPEPLRLKRRGPPTAAPRVQARPVKLPGLFEVPRHS